MQKVATWALAGLAAVGAGTARAQSSAAHKFTVAPDIGVISWDNSSALANKLANSSGAYTKSTLTPTAGVTANYDAWQKLGLGFFFNASRPTTRGDYFPAVLLRFGTDVQLRSVSQRVTVMMYGLQGNYAFQLSKLQPFLNLGFGGVTVRGDPQQNDGNTRFNTTLVKWGGGLGYEIAGGSVLLGVQDYSFLSWNRDKLNPVDPKYFNTSFPTANSTPPVKKSTINNFRISLGFSFVPKLGGSATPEEQE
jgi:hypothetical protein